MSNSKHHFLHSFFYPESVAVVGASRNQATINYNLVSNLVNLGFAGKIYPVNPNAEEILGLKVYPDVKSIQGDIDLAVVSVPADKTPDIVRDCVAKGVKGVTLVPGGFSETGTTGRGVQDEMLNLLRENGIRAIGPNALSPINSRNNLVISFGHIERLLPGSLSFIFQSGLYEARSSWFFSDFHLYLSKLIDLGNKMDINEVDALEYLAQDPETKVIAMHLESIAGDARKFMQLLRETAREKPVIVLKAGRTTAGAKAASSHTGAIIKSSDAVVDAALKQSGAIRVEALDDFFDLGKIFEYFPPMKKNRIALATLSGGEGVIATDLSQLNGLTVARLSPETHSKLRSVFPPWDIPVNPFDMGVCVQFHMGTDTNGVFLQALADDSNVDCCALHLGGFWHSDVDRFLKPFAEMIKRGKPVVTWVADLGVEREMIEQLEARRIPVYPSAERAIKALSALYRYHAMQEARQQ